MSTKSLFISLFFFFVSIPFAVGLASGQGWQWDASEQDERDLLDEHTKVLSRAYEEFNKLTRIKGAMEFRFDAEQVVESVTIVTSKLNNELQIGNEAHYAALVKRIKDNLQGRFPRYQYQIEQLIKKADENSLKQLKRMMRAQLFSLPSSLAVKNADQYQALELRIKQALQSSDSA